MEKLQVGSVWTYSEEQDKKYYTYFQKWFKE